MTESLRIGHGPLKKALILESPDPTLDDHLRSYGMEPFRPEETPSSQEELIKLIEREPWELIYKRSRVEITQRVLDAAPNLHAVMLCCIGDDSVDKVACASKGILVCNDPISNGRSVTELVFGEIICLSRRVFEAVDETNAHRFLKAQSSRFEINGKTLGILGLGNIGKQVAQMGTALGMKVVFHDNRELAKEVGMAMGWTYAPDITSLFANSDYVTCHVSATDHKGRTNAGLLQPEHFEAMGSRGDGSPRIFINLARGHIYEPQTLLDAANKGHVRYAMVDVFPSEPANAAETWVNPFAGAKNILATPHIGAATLEAQPRIARHVAMTTKLLSERGTLRNCVYAPRATVGIESLDHGTNLMTIVHSTARGTKKAIDDAIYEAGASNLGSGHRDFHNYGIAYDVVALDRQFTDEQIIALARNAAKITGEPNTIRAVRTMCFSPAE